MNSEINNQSVNNMPVQEGSVDGVSNNVAPVQTVPEQNATPNVSPNVDSQLQTGQVIVSIQSVEPQPVVQTNEEPVQVQQSQTTTLVAPSKEVQTTISGIVEGMAQVNENENVNPIINEGVANTDNGIREEVKLDTSIAMKGVPTINNSNVSVAVPTHEQKDISEISNQAVINTQKSKTSNTIIIVLLIIMAGCVFFIDDILGFFNTNFAPSIKDNKEEELSNNLIDGYIKLGDPLAYMKTGGIKFYNFSLRETNKVILSFLSDKKLDETDTLGYYIVLYNSEKEITYKELFSIPQKVEANEVSQYKIYLDVDVYEDSKYAKIIKYTDEELAKKYKIVCSYNIENNDIKLNYQNTYAFENDLLVSYTIVKDYSLPDSETEDSKKYKNELDNENAKITEVGIKTEYNNNKLTYSVNMNKIPEGFVPLYKNTATKTMIIKKEKLKKWECK